MNKLCNHFLPLLWLLFFGFSTSNAAECPQLNFDRPGLIDLNNHNVSFTGFYQIDLDSSMVEFKVGILGGGTVKGSFSRFDTFINIPSEHLIDAEVRVALESASVDTGNKFINSVLQGESLFFVNEYPQMRLKVKKIDILDVNKAELTVDLTVRNKTLEMQVPVEFLFALNPDDPRMRLEFSSEVHLKRSIFGLGGMKPFVDDVVHICITNVAYREPPLESIPQQ